MQRADVVELGLVAERSDGLLAGEGAPRGQAQAWQAAVRRGEDFHGFDAVDLFQGGFDMAGAGAAE